MRCWGVKGAYSLHDIKEEELESFLIKSWENGVLGFNVTSPYKMKLAELTQNRVVSAVNILFRGKDSWESGSCDGLGFERGLAHLGVSLDGFNHIVILGSGGVLLDILARVLPYSPQVSVIRRNPKNDEILLNLDPQIEFYPWDQKSLQDLLLKETDRTLLIQASSAPLLGISLEEFVPALNNFEGCFVDLVYRKPSALFYASQEKGLRCQDGLPMFLEQARLSQEIWFGRSLSYEDLCDFLQKTGGADGRN